MSRIRSRGNKNTELALVGVFRAHGITGWRRHLKLRVGELRIESRKPARPAGRLASQPSTFNSQLTVRPDFVFPRLKLAVFVDGCFWHACPRHCRMPTGNRAFWRAKLTRNQARDRLVTRTLRKAGWRVLRIWEHTLRWATTRKKKGRSPPHPGPESGRAALRAASMHLDGRGLAQQGPTKFGGEGAEARLLRRIQNALDSSPRPSPRPRRRGRRGAAATGAGQAR